MTCLSSAAVFAAPLLLLLLPLSLLLSQSLTLTLAHVELDTHTLADSPAPQSPSSPSGYVYNFSYVATPPPPPPTPPTPPTPPSIYGLTQVCQSRGSYYNYNGASDNVGSDVGGVGDGGEAASIECSEACANSTLYLNRCENHMYGNTKLSMLFAASVSNLSYIAVEKYASMNCDAGTLVSTTVLPTGKCLKGDFGARYVYYVSTTFFVPPPSPSGQYAMIVWSPGNNSCSTPKYRNVNSSYSTVYPGTCISTSVISSMLVCNSTSMSSIQWLLPNCKGDPFHVFERGPVHTCLNKYPGNDGEWTSEMLLCSDSPLPPPF